ncbi:MAG: hypothetical protein H6673_10145 [Anaerolineales bacterium]|nr:hypothetical protein [Anaerolineales bacterium]
MNRKELIDRVQFLAGLSFFAIILISLWLFFRANYSLSILLMIVSVILLIFISVAYFLRFDIIADLQDRNVYSNSRLWLSMLLQASLMSFVSFEILGSLKENISPELSVLLHWIVVPCSEPLRLDTKMRYHILASVKITVLPIVPHIR